MLIRHKYFFQYVVFHVFAIQPYFALPVSTVEKQECNYAATFIYLFWTLCLLPLHLISVVSRLCSLVTDSFHLCVRSRIFWK